MVWGLRKKRSNEDYQKLLEDGEPMQEYGSVVDLRHKKSKEKEKVPKINFLNTFKYADRFDILLMVTGCVFAIFTGTCLPITSFFFGGMTNIFIRQSLYGLVPDSVVNRSVSEAMKNAVPVNLWVTDSMHPVPTKNGNVAYEVVYIMKELFVGNVSYPEIWENNTLSSPPLTESEFVECLNRYLVIYLVIGTAILISSLLQTLCWELASERQVHSMRKIYFSQIIRQDISWYDKNEDGNLPNKLSDDLERIREGTGHKFVMIVQYLATFISGICVGLYVNPALTLTCLCVGPFLIVVTAYGSKFAAQHVSREQMKYAKAGAVAEEALTNIKIVSAYSGQPIEIKRYYDALEEGKTFAMKRYDLLAYCLFLNFLLMYAAYGLGFWYGSKMIADGTASPGSIFTVFFSVIAGAFSIGQALPFINIVSAAVGVMASIQEIIQRKVTIDPYSTKGKRPFGCTGRIEFKDVHFRYPSRPSVKILDGLTIDIEPGKTAAICGSSGAGKSTIVSLIQRFYDPVRGEVCLDGIPLTQLNVKWARSQIGLVSQEPVLFGVSIAENIKYGRNDVSNDEVVDAAKQANAHGFITKLPLGYETLVGDTGSQLSGGQKQRIAIARALVRNPKILLLDEATSALDAHSEGIVQDTLMQVMKGRTTVIVAHRLSTIRNADIIYVMQNGKVFESGTHDELMQKRSLYYTLVLAQMSPHESSSGSDKSDENSIGEESDEETRKNLKLAKLVSIEEDTEGFDEVDDEKPSTSRAKKDDNETKIFSRSVTRDDVIGDDYEESGSETGAKKTLEEIFYSENESGKLERNISEVSDRKSSKGDDSGGLRRRKRVSTSRELSVEERSKVPLAGPQETEKDISVWEVMKMQKPEAHWLIFGFLGSAGTGSITPIFALMYGEMFQVFTLKEPAYDAATTFWTCMFAALAVYCGTVYFMQCKGMTESSEGLILRARGQVFENILRQPVGWFDLETSTPGILVNRLARNVPLIKAAAGLRIGQVISAIVTLIGCFTVAVVCGWKLAIALMICIPIFIYASYKQAILLKKNQMRDALLMDDAGRIASETVRNIRTVQSLGQEKLFTELYCQHLEIPYRENKKQGFVYSLMYGIMQGVTFYMYAIAFRLGGYLVQIGDMETANIYKVYFSLSLCAMSIGQSFMYLQDYNKARHATRILNYLLTRKSEIDSSSPFGASPELQGKVEFKNVQFVYPTRPDVKVLRGLSFQIVAGKTLALVGESGCGKSTVISLIERFYDPIGGTILVDGYDIRTINLNYLRSKIGIVNQEPALFDCSIRDNIAYGAKALNREVSFDEIQQAAKTANIHDFIITLPMSYDTMVGERGVQLSGGQKQRVAIARALIRDPKILLLDEATSALDTENEKVVQAALDKAKEGRTCIVVAHRLSTVQNADQICVVSNGKIVEKGSHEELLNIKGHYYDLTQRQCV